VEVERLKLPLRPLYAIFPQSECIDDELRAKKLNRYGHPEGTKYPGSTPVDLPTVTTEDVNGEELDAEARAEAERIVYAMERHSDIEERCSSARTGSGAPPVTRVRSNARGGVMPNLPEIPFLCRFTAGGSGALKLLPVLLACALAGCGPNACPMANAQRCHDGVLEVCDFSSGWERVQPCTEQGKVCVADPGPGDCPAGANACCK
jgi:hypothetical protein